MFRAAPDSGPELALLGNRVPDKINGRGGAFTTITVVVLKRLPPESVVYRKTLYSPSCDMLPQFTRTMVRRVLLLKMNI